MATIKRWVETWLVDFFDEQGEKIETKEVERAYAPTRWAENHVLMLRRKLQGAKVTFSIERVR